MKNIKDANNSPVYETAKETLMYRTVLWTLLQRERVGRFGRMAIETCKISCMKRDASPGSMHDTADKFTKMTLKI